jgi:hypothetical protein
MYIPDAWLSFANFSILFPVDVADRLRHHNDSPQVIFQYIIDTGTITISSQAGHPMPLSSFFNL